MIHAAFGITAPSYARFARGADEASAPTRAISYTQFQAAACW